MSTVIAEHTVRISNDGEVEFTCHGDNTADCHQYPDCGCESWEAVGHQHPFTPHDRCWMQDWFDNDGINPSSDVLDEFEYTPGMWGPIETSFCEEYVEWSFKAARAAGGQQ